MSDQFEILFFGKVENGELVGIPRKKLREQLKHFEGKAIELLIRKKKKHRSIQQNRFYWLSLNAVSDHTGFTPNELHEIFKRMFLKREKANEKTGTLFEYVARTTELTTTEFMGYIESIVQFCATEFDITLPMPNEQTEINLAS